MYIINKCTGTSLYALPIEMYWYMCYNINKIREAENPKPQKGKINMTNKEKRALKAIADRINELASLENCGCSENSKKEFKPYMEWFKCCSMHIRKVLELSDETFCWVKSDGLDEIIRLL